jgi:hypothetical protein
LCELAAGRKAMKIVEIFSVLLTFTKFAASHNEFYHLDYYDDNWDDDHHHYYHEPDKIGEEMWGNLKTFIDSGAFKRNI